MDDLNVYEQYFAAEMTANGRPRHAALVNLIAQSGEGKIRYEAAVSFFPYDDPEDFMVSYDAYFSKTLYEGTGRRSKKREKALLADFRETIDELTKNPENCANFAENGTLWTEGTVFWDQPLMDARGDHRLPPVPDGQTSDSGCK